MKSPILSLALAIGLASIPLVKAQDPLPSWNDTAPKQAITSFVAKVTTGGPDFVHVAERIAVFDNDGTLWSEQPMYFQAFFAFDRVQTLAPDHPEWKNKEPFASILKGDLKAALAGGEMALLELVRATHAGLTTEDFKNPSPIGSPPPGIPKPAGFTVKWSSSPCSNC